MLNTYIECYPTPIECRNVHKQYWNNTRNRINVFKDCCYNPQYRLEKTHWRTGCIEYEYIDLCPLAQYKCKTKAGAQHCAEWKGKLKIGNIEYRTERFYSGVEPNIVLNRTKANGDKYDDWHKVIKKCDLIAECEALTDKPIKKSYTKKQLYDHLIKYA